MQKQLTIEIKDLTFKTIIGILPFEREKKQKVIVNISFNYIYTKDYFIDYSQVAALIEQKLKEKKFELLEDAIIYCEKKLNNLYKIKELKIKISKPDILKNTIVSLSN